MPHFIKQEHELETRLDKWMYFIRHFEDFHNILEIFKDDVFIKAFGKAEIAKFSEEKRHNYEQSLKNYRDLKGFIYTTFEDEQIQRTLEIVRKGKLMGLSTDDLIKLTALINDQIDGL